MCNQFYIKYWAQETEAVAQTCSVKKVFLEISQNSQKMAVPESLFLIKLQVSGLQLY